MTQREKEDRIILLALYHELQLELLSIMIEDYENQISDNFSLEKGRK